MLRFRRSGLCSIATAAAVALLGVGKLLATPIVTQVIDGTGDGQGHGLDLPWGIVIDSAGNVFVAAAFSDDVLRRAPDGTITAVLDANGDGLGHPLDGPEELAIGADDSIYVTAFGSKNVFKRTPSGTITQILDATGDGAGHPLMAPHGLAVDAAANVFVSDVLTDRVFRIDPTGSVTSVLTAIGDGAGHTLNEPGTLVTDSAGNLYVAGERSHNVFRVSPSGTITELVNASALLDFPTALALDAAGNLYVGDFNTLRIFRVSPAGTVSQYATGIEPVALAMRPDGVLLVAESNARRISGIRPSGLRCVLLDGSGDGVHPFGFASRFTLRGDGVVFASNAGFDGVFEIQNGCPSAPPVDTTGRWRVSVTYPPDAFFPPPPPSTFLQDWTQSGFDLSVSDPSTSSVTFTGTIDDRNHFFLESVAADCVVPGYCCPAQSLSGDVAAGGQDWLASLSDNVFDPRLECVGVYGPAAAFGSRCGNGVLDPGETCDDGNWTPGDGCDAACGRGSLCGNGVLEPGEECDDGNRLVRDGCDATCKVEQLCGDGIVDAGEGCDDGNVTPGDGCDAQCHLEPCYGCSGNPSQCRPVILTCDAPRSRGSRLTLHAGSATDPPLLRWKASTNGPVAIDVFGDPSTRTSYHLCLFDGSGSVPRLLAYQPFVSGPPWRSRANGFTYRATSADEARMLKLRSGTSGKVAVRLRTAALSSLSLPLPLPLTVQVQTNDAACFEAEFSATGVAENDAKAFRAVSDP